MSTLKNILKKKQSGEIKTKEVDFYESKLLGEKIEVRKKPASVYLDIIAKHDIGEDMKTSPMPLMNELIFTFCPMFEDQEGVKSAMAQYGAVEPLDLPEYIFESNMDEIGGVVEVINGFYNIEEIGEDIKN